MSTHHQLLTRENSPFDRDAIVAAGFGDVYTLTFGQVRKMQLADSAGYSAEIASGLRKLKMLDEKAR